ncbi:MAG: phosphoenolpyruvate--protein phosphotransferase [Erysipelotrichia bacterium]|nr:phosphoenolpyruvate--protein phosphotransferase [Candidatus Riflebacteria bacterium]NCB38388.1 phosphoenolpyruvate--protein phosphotransferase [Erysipelotrichia bacterium]
MLKGLAISPGYALGRLHCLRHTQLENIEGSTIPPSEIESEIERFKAALELSQNEISQLLELPQIKSSLEISNIFQAHMTLIEDPDLQKEVTKRIRENMRDVQSIVSAVIKDYSNFFRNLPDPQFQGKAIDIMDVGKRILKNCQRRKNRQNTMDDFAEGMIIVAEDLTPSEIVSFNPARIRGIAIEEGTPTSHASILARSLGIPALIQVKTLMQKARNGNNAIIDSSNGQIILNPDDGLQKKYAAELEGYQKKQRQIMELLSEPSVTKDGVSIALKANIGQLSDVDSVISNHANGVGLYRTEFSYLTRRTFPTENELYDSYSAVVEKLGDSDLVIRTIDIGGDKISHLMGNALERNPELGWRAVRMSLDCEEVFCTQLRAILRAAAKKPGQVSILFPMISNIEELRKIKVLLNRMHEDLIKSGMPVPDHIRLGIMVEIPSVALLAEKFAREVDFFSIGSNDLVQYTLAVDRTNSKVSHLYQPANPAVIKLIDRVVKVANQNKVGVSLCGEMAGDPRYTVLLLGMGLRELSMNSILIPGIKQVIRNISFAEAEHIIEPVLNLDTAEEIENALNKINSKLGLQ